MALIHEISAFSYGDFRCHFVQREANAATGAYAVASLHRKGSDPRHEENIKIYLHSPAEIAAFRALSEALAKQDVVEGVEV